MPNNYKGLNISGLKSTTKLSRVQVEPTIDFVEITDRGSVSENPSKLRTAGAGHQKRSNASPKSAIGTSIDMGGLWEIAAEYDYGNVSADTFVVEEDSVWIKRRKLMNSAAAISVDWSNITLEHTLDNPNPFGTSENDQFGMAVAMSSTHAIIGAEFEDDAGGTTSGKAYIFDVTTGSLLYTLDNPNAYGTSDSDFFGDSVAISGGRAIVGAVGEDEDGNSNSGKAYIFSAPITEASAPAEESTGWTIDLSNVTYNTEFSLNNQMASYATGQTLSTDGTKLYVVGQTQNIYAEWIIQVFQYSLSTAFDTSTASYDNVTFNPSSQDTNTMGIAFNTDGTKMYLVGTNSDLVLQYSLSTPWDVSTASYDNVSISAPAAFGLYFKDDGTKMYTTGFDANFTGVRSFSLSTGFDLSTATDDLSTYSSIAVTGENPFSAALNPDGTKMYILGAGYNESIYRYSLSTAFDVSTATYDNESISLSNELHLMYNMEISRDGTKIYVVGTSPGTGPTTGSSRSVLQFDTGL
jgi:hypothetical protein